MKATRSVSILDHGRAERRTLASLTSRHAPREKDDVIMRTVDRVIGGTIGLAPGGTALFGVCLMDRLSGVETPSA
jgi:hypothetical protein